VRCRFLKRSCRSNGRELRYLSNRFFYFPYNFGEHSLAKSVECPVGRVPSREMPRTPSRTMAIEV